MTIFNSPPRFARGGTCRLLRTLPAAMFFCALVVCQLCGSAAFAETNLRLRIAWGGGAARQWQGDVTISEGSLSQITPLGLEADEPGSMLLQGRSVTILERSARTYDGLDLLVTAPLTAKLKVRLAPKDRSEGGGSLELPLTDLVANTGRADLDKQGNRLLVRRVPGDRLRIRFDRESLLFAPGETFELEPAPHLASIDAGQSLKCVVELLEARSGGEIWSGSRNFRSRRDGVLENIGPFGIPMPEAEGVYDVRVTIVTRRFGVPLVRSKPLLERKIQLVVVGKDAPVADLAAWEEQVAIDPARPGWWERVKQSPQLKLIPGFGRSPLGNGKARAVKHGALDLIEMDPDGWQAYPLPIDNVGWPHILEVEYPADHRQTLGISIVEPNAAGMVVPLTLDSGVDVPQPHADTAAETRRHRLIFYPRTKTPLALLTNKRGDSRAMFGKIRVLAGPRSLPPAMPEEEKANSGRLLAAYFDKPLLAENFGAGKTIDPVTGQARDDWVKFYIGARRMIDYLKHAGYNGAVISVVREGSTIYPSKLLEPTPKFDDGVFVVGRPDPLRKDVLEMLLRLFDREGLTLVPAVDFSSPLPALEKLRISGVDAATGIDLVDGKGLKRGEGESDPRHPTPYYNPLDERVQDAMQAVIEELASRYGHHRAFGGAALQMGPSTYARLPGLEWGCDDRTFGRFAGELRLAAPTGEGKFAKRSSYLRGEGRDKWLAWRGEQLARLHRRMQTTLARSQPNAKLYLTGAQMFQGRAARDGLRPALPRNRDAADVILTMGIDLEQYRDQAGIVLPRPGSIAPLTSLSQQGIDVLVNHSDQIEKKFSTLAGQASLFFHQAQIAPLPSFDAASPFGKEKTRMMLVTHTLPSAEHNRRRLAHAVATRDVQTILDGGWLLPLGQEDALRQSVQVYRSLPAARFADAPRRDGRSPAQPVTVRQLTQGERTYFYLVNDSPWPVKVELTIDAPAGCRLLPLGAGRLPPLGMGGRAAALSIELAAYELQGGVMTSSRASITDWDVELPAPALAELRRKMDQVRARAIALQNPQPTDVLQNASFEKPPEMKNTLPGWSYRDDPSTHVASVSNKRYEGNRSLKMTSSNRTLRIRSEAFPPPATGRVSVSVQLCLADEAKQPPLRLVVEGKHNNGSPYYRYATVGAGNGAPPLKEQWSHFLFHIDDLPVDRLAEVRVGFDLMGPGQVWLDNVRVFDLWFQNNERNELFKNIALADIQFKNQKITDCERFLDGYWSRFLMEHVDPQPRLAEIPRRQAELAPLPDGPPGAAKKNKWNWLPKRVWPFK